MAYSKLAISARPALFRAPRLSPVAIRNLSSRIQTEARSSLYPFALPTAGRGVLAQCRQYATDPSTAHSGSASSSSTPFPPPGYDSEKAKKTLLGPSDQAATSTATATTASASSSTKLSENKDVAAQLKSVVESGQQKGAAVAENSSAADQKSQLPAEDAADKKLAEKKKLTLWQKVKKEVAHYRDGTKLLAMEVKISSRLAFKMAAGYELTRREARQLQRTVKDLSRLVPFSMFVIVPFAELLLPVALKLFPNMLPSTYEGKKDREKKAESLRATRKEVSKFLRETLRESGLPVTVANAKREEFTEFFRKVRSTAENPSREEVIEVCRIFKDDITLDNLSRPQLVAICRYMNLNHVGPDTLLRYTIRHRMRQIKRDDKAISFEGVNSLSVPEVQMACAHRGLPTHGRGPARLRDDLQLWLDLRLKYGLPSTLLVLSNVFGYVKDPGPADEISTQVDALQAVLSSIPEELFHEIELEVHNAEGAATNRQRLEVIKEQEELIDEENMQHLSSADDARPAVSVNDTENIDDDSTASSSSSSADGATTTATQEEQPTAAEAESDAGKAKDALEKEAKS